MLTELTFAIRALLRRPHFLIAAASLIAVGIAVSTTAFSIVRKLFYQPRSGIVDASSIYNVHRAVSGMTDFGSWSYPDYLALRERSTLCAGLVAFTGVEAGFYHDGASRSLKTQLVSANFFDVLGTKPALGHFFVPDDDIHIGTRSNVVISHRLWRDEFASRTDIIGADVRINNISFTVVGIAPAGFHGTFIGFDFDLWIPVSMARVIGEEGDLTIPNAEWLEVFGRLAPGATAASAKTELQQIYTQQSRERSADDRDARVFLMPNRPIDDSLRGTALGFAGVLSGISGLVLLVACLNVAALLLTREEERRRENAVRLALGCSSLRLVGQWLAETLIIFCAGGLGGFVLAQWLTKMPALQSLSLALPLAFDFSPDSGAFLFSLAAAICAGLVTGLIPAWRAAHSQVVDNLRAGGRGATDSSWLRNAMVTGQIAFSLVPLVVAGLFARTLSQTLQTHPGFDAANLLVTTLNLQQLGGDIDDKGLAVAERLRERALTVAGVEAATLSNRIPLGRFSLRTFVTTENPATPMPTNGFLVGVNTVDSQYFDTMHIPILRGRALNLADRSDGPGSVVINTTMAKQLFGSLDVVDREMQRGSTTLRIVGVARDVAYARLWETSIPQIYIPIAGQTRPIVTLTTRVTGNPNAVAPGLQRVLMSAQPDLPLAPPVTVESQIAATLFPQRLGAGIAAALGGTSLFLAAGGLYGVLALGLLRQSREFGIRIALGAQTGDILALVARRVIWIAGAGIITGGLLAFCASQLLRGFIHGVANFDPVTYAIVGLVLVVVACLASWLPAKRVLQIDPVVALRAE
jgi:predicted permease